VFFCKYEYAVVSSIFLCDDYLLSSIFYANRIGNAVSLHMGNASNMDIFTY